MADAELHAVPISVDESVAPVDVEKLTTQHDQMVAEIQQLVFSLESARKVYERNLQKGAHAALKAILDYLDTIEVQIKLQAPLIGLLGAIEDLSRGRSNPHTSKAPGKGPAATLQDAIELSYAAAAVTLLLDGGYESEDAAVQYVRRKTGERFTDAKIRNFRGEVSSSRKKVMPEAKSNYEIRLAEALESGLSRRKAAQAFIETINTHPPRNRVD